MYGTRYSIPFKNRENVNCEVRLRSNDSYGGAITTLTGAASPFTLSSQAQDNQIPYGIKATESVIEFYNTNSVGTIIVDLEIFYNEDDTYWLVEFYYNSVFWWTGFLQLDNCIEQITDVSHIISLNANDGLARLQNCYFYIGSPLLGSGQPLIEDWKITEHLTYILNATGLALNTKAWLNIFENSTDDRSVHDYLTMLPQTAFSTRYFVNDDGTTITMYDALNKIITDLRCIITQAEGCWQIIRWGDIRLFSDGTMPGTLYDSIFNGLSTPTAITFAGALSIDRNLSVIPINENQQSRILRPYQYSKETFNYAQPPLITQSNLKLPVGATPYANHTVGSIRYDDYDLPTYFTTWVQRGGVTTYLEVANDTSTFVETETDRYIVIIGDDSLTGGIQFNPIQVTKGDKFDFSLRWRTDVDTNSLIRFWIRFVLVTDHNTDWNLTDQGGGGSNEFQWSGPSVSADLWDTGLGIYKELTSPTNVDTTQWMDWSLSNSEWSTQPIPVIPDNGVVLIEVRGPNAGSQTGRQNVYFKDIQLTFNEYINNSIQIIGQTHDNSQTPAIKQNLQTTPTFDDSPRNTVNGTLFTDALSNFDYTDINTGAHTDIGNLYFTRTQSWHRQGVTEARRLGDLNTFNDLFMQRILRVIVQGDFYGLSGVHLLRVLNLTFLEQLSKRFIFGAASFDYMSCIWNASLYEIFDSGEVDGDLTNTYLFNYLYNTGK